MRRKEDFERATWDQIAESARFLSEKDYEQAEFALRTALSLIANMRLLLEDQKT